MVYQFGLDGEDIKGEPMNSNDPNHRLEIYFHLVDVLALIIGWSLTSITGVMLWFAPTDKGVSIVAWLFSLLQHEWGKLHLFMGVITLFITVVHLIVYQRILRSLNNRQNLWE